ncbi:MAG: phosphohydrolase [Bacteroidota bacterium]
MEKLQRLISWSQWLGAQNQLESGLLETKLASLWKRYQEPHRAYHNPAHLYALYEHWQKWEAAWKDKLSVGWAILYHDAIYDPFAKDNEEQSARLAWQDLQALGLPKQQIERIVELIICTQTHEVRPGDGDAARFISMDLAILASEPAAYEAYAQAVRKEYARVPGFLYKKGRRKVLKHFLQKAVIYPDPGLRKAWEQKARSNLEREYLALGGKPF